MNGLNLYPTTDNRLEQTITTTQALFCVGGRRRKATEGLFFLRWTGTIMLDLCAEVYF